MSRTTTSVSKIIPSSAAGVSLVTAAAWVTSAWVQATAATSESLYIIGIAISDLNNQPMEIDIGTGASGAETVLHTIRFQCITDANSGLRFVMLPLPVGLISLGARVALRGRTQTGGTAAVHLITASGLTGTHTTILPMKCAPSAANSIGVTPSGVAWTNTAWVQVTASVASVESALLGIFVTAANANSVSEWDIGTGASGAETVLTTVRHTTRTAITGPYRALWFPAPMPVAASTRVSVRLRVSTTGVSQELVSLLFVQGTTLL